MLLYPPFKDKNVFSMIYHYKQVKIAPDSYLRTSPPEVWKS